MSVGKMNRRVTFFNETYVIDAGGGPSQVTTESWVTWAEIADRTGVGTTSQSQDITTYDYRVRARFDGRITTNTMMTYEGQVCKMNYYTIESEGYKNYMVLRFTKTDTYIDLS